MRAFMNYRAKTCRVYGPTRVKRHAPYFQLKRGALKTPLGAKVAKDIHGKWYYNNMEWGDWGINAPEQNTWLFKKSSYFNFPLKKHTCVQ